jgi:hypothetical protein
MSVPSPHLHIYTIRRDNETVGFYHRRKPYIIGFRNAAIARSIKYLIPSEPPIPFDLVSTDHITLQNLLIDNNSTLFIPKHILPALGPFEEEFGYAIEQIKYDDFVLYPMTKKIGVVIPYVLLNESDKGFTYRSHTIHPLL